MQLLLFLGIPLHSQSNNSPLTKPFLNQTSKVYDTLVLIWSRKKKMPLSGLGDGERWNREREMEHRRKERERREIEEAEERRGARERERQIK